ncbi:hypothetical protein [Streptomyces sp. NPDC058045]
MSDPRPERTVRRCPAPLNALHSAHYFAPELGAELAAIGIEDPSAA